MANSRTNIRWINIWQHPWSVAASNILLVMAVYSLSRVFFYWINLPMFPNVSPAHLAEMLGGGLRFDLTAVLYLSSVYLLLLLLPLPAKWRMKPTYQKIATWFLILPNVIGFVTNFIDTIYVRFTDRRTTITFFSEFGNDSNIGNIFFQSLVQYWFVTVFGIVLITLFILLTRKRFRLPSYPDNGSVLGYYSAESAILCISIYFIIIGIRGGFGAYTRPITLSNALQYADAPQETMIVLNTPFSIMRSTEGSTYTNPEYMSEQEMENTFSPVRNTFNPIDSTYCKNVVIIILESFSKEYIGFYNHHLDNGNYKGYTPFLDSLLHQSLTYSRSFASGRKSIDAMPSILSSIPMLREPYVVSPYSTNRVSSLADCLKQKGYTTAFFHGAPNGSMGFQAYARSAGFEDYYGMNQYDGDDAFDGTWAVWDEEFLLYFARTMSDMQEPFLTAVFTASSHHPFKVPERYENTFPIGTQPIHQCVGYSDYALRQFFNLAETQPWYNNTLFVLTADHTNQLTHPEYLNAKGLFEVPIAFFTPDGTITPALSHTTVSQTDIMPSVLAYLGYDMTFFSFGENALTEKKNHPYAITYNNPLYQIFSDSLMLQFDGQKTTAVFNFTEDPILHDNILPHISQRQDIMDMEHYLKAYIQQYMSRMIENRLTAE